MQDHRTGQDPTPVNVSERLFKQAPLMVVSTATIERRRARNKAAKQARKKNR